MGRPRKVKPEEDQVKAKVVIKLSEDIKHQLIAGLQATGAETKDVKSDEDLLKLTCEHMKELFTRSQVGNVDEAQGKVKQYAKYQGCLLKDIEFITRLYFLNVPAKYLPLFRDEDHVFSDEDIWSKIRHSDIK